MGDDARVVRQFQGSLLSLGTTGPWLALFVCIPVGVKARIHTSVASGTRTAARLHRTPPCATPPQLSTRPQPAASWWFEKLGPAHEGHCLHGGRPPPVLVMIRIDRNVGTASSSRTTRCGRGTISGPSTATPPRRCGSWSTNCHQRGGSCCGLCSQITPGSTARLLARPVSRRAESAPPEHGRCDGGLMSMGLGPPDHDD